MGTSERFSAIIILEGIIFLEGIQDKTVFTPLV